MAITRRGQQTKRAQSGQRLRSGTVVITTGHQTRTKRTEMGPGSDRDQPKVRRGSRHTKRKETVRPARLVDRTSLTSLTKGATDDRRNLSKLMVVDNSAPEDLALASISSEFSERQIGVPRDGEWEVVEALDRRFCYEHGGYEWLLQVAEVWLQPDDFKISDALHKLETRKKLDTEKSVKTESKVCYAECNSCLWSQVDRVTRDDLVNGNRYFRIRWMPYWFQEKDVDLDFAKKSLEKRFLLLRRSGRNNPVKAGLAAGQKGILSVLAIE